jgi:hypothetical protein
MRIAFALIVLSSCAAAQAAEPVKSADGLESDLSACLMKSAKDGKCMETILGKSILPGNDEMVTVAAQMDQLLGKWLGTDSVYAVHRLRSRQLGDIYEKRSYFIEDTTGSLMLLDLALLKRLGKWYVYQFNLTSKSDELTAAFKE